MANKSNSREVPQNSTASRGNKGQSGLDSTQMRSGDRMKGGPGGGMKGNPQSSGDRSGSGNRSGGQGNVSQQSNVDSEGGAPSRQTSTAQDEEGQL